MKINKKIGLLALILLVIAGMVVVILRGFNVSLMSRQHESLDIVLGKTFDVKDVRDICDKVFPDKKYIVRVIEVFKDAVEVNVESATDEEKQNLINELNTRYGLELKVEDITVRVSSNVRIRDMIIPYIVPVMVSMVLITVYFIIRFRKMNALKLLGNFYGLILISIAVFASVVAIVRIPFSSIIVYLMAVITVIEIVLVNAYLERNYNKFAFENTKNLK